MMLRRSRDSILLEVADTMAKRSTCERAKVGCVIAREGRIISTGYGGAPSGMPHCTDVGCEVVNDHCVRTSHAEAGAIAYAARVGVSLEGSTIYITHSPCPSCAKLIINAGIGTVIFKEFYGDEGLFILTEAGVTSFHFGRCP